MKDTSSFITYSCQSVNIANENALRFLWHSLPWHQSKDGHILTSNDFLIMQMTASHTCFRFRFCQFRWLYLGWMCWHVVMSCDNRQPRWFRLHASPAVVSGH